MKRFFILGARDPEMAEIERVLTEQQVPWTFATIGGGKFPRRVKRSNAYEASSIEGLIPPGSRLVFVECSVMGLLADEICDHHNEGDPGWGLPPEQYLEGSSLGQTLKILGLEPTKEQRIIAAADHCLWHAYDGKCPGVDPVELAAWREHNRATNRAIPVEVMQARIEQAKQELLAAPRVNIAGAEVAWFPDGDAMSEEVSDASARLGVPFCYFQRRGGHRAKVCIKTAQPDVIDAWMKSAATVLHDIYGDPARGYAGGYLDVPQTGCATVGPSRSLENESKP